MTVATGVLLVFLSGFARADEWFCDSQSSRRPDASTFQVCGVAKSSNEADARNAALEDAKREFATICAQDKSCQGFATTLIPKRQSCSHAGNEFRCVRMVEYQLDGQGKPSQGSDILKPSSPPKVASAPVEIEIGMTLEQLVARYGKPDLSLPVDDKFLIVNYVKPFCLPARCTVGMKIEAGIFRVYKFDGFTKGSAN